MEEALGGRLRIAARTGEARRRSRLRHGLVDRAPLLRGRLPAAAADLRGGRGRADHPGPAGHGHPGRAAAQDRSARRGGGGGRARTHAFLAAAGAERGQDHGADRYRGEGQERRCKDRTPSPRTFGPGRELASRRWCRLAGRRRRRDHARAAWSASSSVIGRRRAYHSGSRVSRPGCRARVPRRLAPMRVVTRARGS